MLFGENVFISAASSLSRIGRILFIYCWRGVSYQAEELGPERARIADLCTDLRIECEIKIFALELHGCPDFGDIGSTKGNLSDPQTDMLNGLIQRHSTETCVLFTYLPTPSSSLDASSYLSKLRKLTDNLPPVVLVNGQETVSTRVEDAV